MSSAGQHPPPKLEETLHERAGKPEGREIRFRCPYPDRHNHGDTHPSARYNRDKHVWRCDVCENGGGWKDLCRLFGIPLDEGSGSRPSVIARYLYCSENGDQLRRKVRWEPGFRGSKKSFSWEKPSGDGTWAKCKGDGNPKCLYGSEKLPIAREAGERVFVVEGEKDCDSAGTLGLFAVCNPEGAAQSKQQPKWKEAYSKQLKGLEVVVIADKDAPGRAHAAAIAASLVTHAASVVALELPGEGVKDLSDWIALKVRSNASSLDICAELEQLVASTNLWEPGEEEELRDEATDQEPPPPTQAKKLIGLAESVTLFHSPDEEPYATLNANGHEENWPIRSKSFRRWMLRQFYMTEGKPPSAQALKDSIDVLEANAQFDGEELPVFTRIAGTQDAIYLDLANERWEGVEITAHGWRVISRPPVKFIRSKGMRPLPTPIKQGSILALKDFINVPDESDFLLVVAWLLAALRPAGPFPILVLQGEQGSAKSTAARILRALVDPATSPIRSMPKEEHDLMITARNAWVLAFDNISGIPHWLSDALCRLATGGGFSTRQLFSDAEETILDAQRPIVLNGIEDLVNRQDLLDRSLIAHLPTISESERRPESELWREFDAASPAILGALLTALSTGLAELPTVKLSFLPRMADFAVWISATEPALPWPRGSFLRAYAGNREESVQAALESDPVATALLELVGRKDDWEGTATELLTELASLAPEGTTKSRTWPKTARVLSGQLRRAATFLRGVGVTLEFHRGGGTGSRRLLAIRKDPEFCVASVACVAGVAQPADNKESTEATQEATQTTAATQEATQEPSANTSKDGHCDARDARDAKSRPFSASTAATRSGEPDRRAVREVPSASGASDVSSRMLDETEFREVINL